MENQEPLSPLPNTVPAKDPRSSKRQTIVLMVGGLLLMAATGGWTLYRYLTTTFINPDQESPATIQQGDTTNWKTYRNEEYRFEFGYPSSVYSIKISNKPETPEMLLAINLPGNRNPYELIRHVSISVWNNSQKLSLLEWATANRNFSNFGDPYIPNEDFKNEVIGDKEAISFLWGGGADGKTVIINNEDVIILLSASASVGSPTDRVWQDFDQILSTFKFISTSTSFVSYEELVKSLPPDPGEAGKKTLEGIDSDWDGVRDDVQRWIVLSYPSSTKKQYGLQQLTIALTAYIAASDQSEAKSTNYERQRAVNCLYLIDGVRGSDDIQDLKAQFLNTEQRLLAYYKSEGMKGTSTGIENNNVCNFDLNSLPN